MLHFLQVYIYIYIYTDIVGYGDYYPVTNEGRMIAIVVAFGGTILSAVIIGLVHQNINMTTEEQSVFSFIFNHKISQIQKTAAIRLIQYSWRLSKLRKSFMYISIIYIIEQKA